MVSEQWTALITIYRPLITYHCPGSVVLPINETESIGLVIDIVIIISASFLFGIFAHKLKQSVILAYIAVGILIGPYGFGLISKIGEINAMAEIGIALLMFVIGIEFRFSKIGNIWKVIIIGGISQIIFMILAGYSLSRFIGFSIPDSLILGMIGSVSSTMIVVKILTERRELEQLYSRIMVGLLIVQDLAVVIMVCFIINLENIAKGYPLDFIKVLGTSGLAVTAIVLIGRKLLPRVMYLIIKMENKEMLLLSIFSFAIGISVTTHLLGMSISLGAFIAGFLLSEAEYNLEVSSQIRPLKDIFIVIFFVSIGLFINPGVLLDNSFLILFIVLIMMLFKFASSAIPTWAFGYDGKTAVKVGMGMMQIGEFSFLMLTIGQKNGFLSPSTFSSTIAAALISIILTPLAISQADRVYNLFAKKSPLGRLISHIPHYRLSEKKDKGDKTRPTNHVIICGFGSSGMKVVKGLRDKFDMVIIEHDVQKIRGIRNEGYQCLYGDAMDHHLLIRANIATARILILTIPDIKTKKIVARYAKVYNPDITVIARARDEIEKEELQHIGIDYVIIPQSLEALEAIDIICKVMT